MMFRYMIAIETQLIIKLYERKALCVEFAQRRIIAIKMIENTELHAVCSSFTGSNEA